MRGSLGLFNLLDLLQLLGSNKSNGCLSIYHPTEGDARIYFTEGNIIHIHYAGQQDLEALKTLLRDEQGSFEFIPNRTPQSVTIEKPLDQFLFSAIRDLDAPAPEDKPQPVAVDADVPVILDDSRMATLSLDEQEFEIIKLIDGTRTVSEIGEASQVPSTKVKETFSRLASLGLINLKKPEPRVARLVIGLSRDFDGMVAYVDESIVQIWSKTQRAKIENVRMRDAGGRELSLKVRSAPNIGPYLLLSSTGLLGHGLRAGASVLVKPEL